MKNTDISIQNNILNDYSNGISNKEISVKYGLHRTTIQRILLRNNIELRKQNQTARKHKIINENYFNNIIGDEKGYVLGLLYSDGYINKNGFGISLIENDKELLEQLSIIFYGKIILRYKPSRRHSMNTKYISKPQYSLEIISNKMKNDLINCGCVQRKTFKIRFPKLIDEDTYRGFIRGYFDGDGGVTIPKNKMNNISIRITSNIYFCDCLANYIKNTVNINAKLIKRYGEIGSVNITGKNQIKKFFTWLYLNKSIYMERKYEKLLTNLK